MVYKKENVVSKSWSLLFDTFEQRRTEIVGYNLATSKMHLPKLSRLASKCVYVCGLINGREVDRIECITQYLSLPHTTLMCKVQRQQHCLVN